MSASFWTSLLLPSEITIIIVSTILILISILIRLRIDRYLVHLVFQRSDYFILFFRLLGAHPNIACFFKKQLNLLLL